MIAIAGELSIATDALADLIFSEILDREAVACGGWKSQKSDPHFLALKSRRGKVRGAGAQQLAVNLVGLEMLSHTMKNQIAVVFLLMLLLAALLALASSAVACPPDMYSNSLHHCVPRPDDCAHQKPGELPVTAICNDGRASGVS